MATSRIHLLAFSACALLLGSLLAACGTSAPLDSPPAADELRVNVTRFNTVASPPASAVVFLTTTTDPSTIRAVQADLQDIPLIKPNESLNCSTNGPVYYSYTLTFSSNGVVVEQAAAQAPACPIWTITTSRGSAHRFEVSTQFWTRLRQETGAPLPQP